MVSQDDLNDLIFKHTRCLMRRKAPTQDILPLVSLLYQQLEKTAPQTTDLKEIQAQLQRIEGSIHNAMNLHRLGG